MIISCDPPRHALLIHFGKRLRDLPLAPYCTEIGLVRLEFLLDLTGEPPSLVAVHFPRHCYRLPFVSGHEIVPGAYRLEYGKRGSLIHFYFSDRPKDLIAVQAYPGLAVLVRPGAPDSDPGPSLLERRPVLYGMWIDETSLALELDTTEMRTEFGVDNLKDIDVSLFCRYPKTGKD